jgi:DNA-binding IclR family transcriptional regulator
MTTDSPKPAERDPLAKGLKLLRWLMQEHLEEFGVREAAHALSLTPSSAHRLLAALLAEGFVQKNPNTGRYRLGMDVYRLAYNVIDRVPLRRLALPHMRRLVEACNEASYLGVYSRDRQEMVTVASVESTQALRYVIELYKWKPVYVGASGLAIMAFLPSAERQAIIARTRLEPVTERSITEPYRLEHELALIRERGYACTHGQRIRGAVGMAAPVFGPGGEVIGDVCLSLPEQRFEPGNEAPLAHLLMQCARDVMAEMGTLPALSRAS